MSSWDEDITDSTFNRRAADKIKESASEIGQLKVVVDDLNQRFIIHDKAEVAVRNEQIELNRTLIRAVDKVTDAIHELTQENKSMHQGFSAYQLLMKPAQDSITWIAITQKMVLWGGSLAGGALALIKFFESDYFRSLFK